MNKSITTKKMITNQTFQIILLLITTTKIIKDIHLNNKTKTTKDIHLNNKTKTTKDIHLNISNKDLSRINKIKAILLNNIIRTIKDILLKTTINKTKAIRPNINNKDLFRINTTRVIHLRTTTTKIVSRIKIKDLQTQTKTSNNSTINNNLIQICPMFKILTQHKKTKQ